MTTAAHHVKEPTPDYSPFDDDVAFLSRYGEVIVLTDPEGKSKVAVMPGLQGRVMTSTAAPLNLSYGWINRSFFEKGETSVHMNAFGGEERIWLGPEGGQFSIFFSPGSAFTFDNWHTPRLIDLDPYKVVSRSAHAAQVTKAAELTNYSGTQFKLRIERDIRVLEAGETFALFEVTPLAGLSSVAYETTNRLYNTGKDQWRKDKGLLSIWLLGMFNPSSTLTMIIPYKEGPEEDLGPIVNDDYFGKVPSDRLRIADKTIFFRGDGKHRSKIGLGPTRATPVMGSYDAGSGTLTVVKFSQGQPEDVYVNSKWELQKAPYAGDVINAYNDGPPAPGTDPMGPFYELESSSPAKELNPGQHVEHIQTTCHFQGEPSELDQLARHVLGVSLNEINNAFGP